MFFEEARELLIGLEEGLMDLERRQADRAHLDKTFRAAHSLKGAAGMVGLKVIAEFTNGIEAVLERIRAGLLVVDSDIITTLLESRDHPAAMVEAEAAHSPIPPSSDLTQRLTSLFRAPGPTPPAASGPPSLPHPPSLPQSVRELPGAPPAPESPPGTPPPPPIVGSARDAASRPSRQGTLPPPGDLPPPRTGKRSSKARETPKRKAPAAAKQKKPQQKTRSMKQV